MASDLVTIQFRDSMSAAERLLELRSKSKLFSYRDFDWSLQSEDGIFIFRLTIYFEQDGFGVFQAKSQLKLPANFQKTDFYRKLRRYSGNSQTSQEDHSCPYARSLDRLVFLIGMAELPSYWKAYASETVSIDAGPLSETERAWWLDLYWNGLGEFIYLNDLSLEQESLMQIETLPVSETADADEAESLDPYNERETLLIPIGGGKDSIVSLERLDKEKLLRHVFCINPNQATLDTLRIASISGDRRWQWSRRIDPKLLDLNARGFLNGHTPFSSVLAFYSYVTAYLGGHRWIILSNEASANEATIPGTHINHQYSKSAEFEEAFREYSASFPGTIEYFSLLRPFSELQIARDFSEHPQYFDSFRSCNLGSRGGQNVWCGECPKCLFVYILLSPWIEPERLNSIIERDMWDASDLKKTFDELTGYLPEKPFECVGTPEETRLATILCLMTHYENQPIDRLPYLLRRFVQQLKEGTWSDIEWRETSDKWRISYHGPDLLNERYAHLIPERFWQHIRTNPEQESLKSLLSARSEP